MGGMNNEKFKTLHKDLVATELETKSEIYFTSGQVEALLTDRKLIIVTHSISFHFEVWRNQEGGKLLLHLLLLVRFTSFHLSREGSFNGLRYKHPTTALILNFSFPQSRHT